MVVVPWPDHRLSLAEWDALEPDPLRRYELVEGVVVVVPRPVVLHQYAMLELRDQLKTRLPADLLSLSEVEVAIPGHPPTVRVPDLVVCPRSVLAGNPKRLEASDVLLAVEIVSPGTERTDTVTKLAEYADAGIPSYWILDLEPPVTLSAYLLVDGDYEIVAKGSGRLTLLSPVELAVDLDRLLP